ncbi:GNAT family N-acetyltransferase [Amnibacterium kyonggiense]|uniref:L-amino acid N-acyltransferase YncA n=1 Tax=Amnibacterium kyonggiense TaxID=595671 RepID=A0A4R7FLR1_9MICO|nr:GNAT family N-acetyltransferase [Amnibacterium kyonggiense]TDS77337.1 L-amino acid N-acyltransferase YncA [Amnibacterium kyonggiense]
MEIREATPADAEAIGRMHWASWREAYAPLLPEGFFTPEGEARRVEQWRRILAGPASPDVVLRIAERDGSVVGHASAGPARPNDTAGAPVRERELWSIYVLASEYGTGLADRLLTAVLPDDVPAELWVFEANPRAIAFYAKHGFRPDGARHVFGPELNGQPEIRLVR